ncbi:MAG: 4-hydroxy-3-methylbut-2-enyl diphosphate reductase [Gammaproteobacteria bacterium]|nr:MAG: 4-hydroxy-3-methylbut-2-enyl diphosphate reductase [Gammaproteobacteria bacterium]
MKVWLAEPRGFCAGVERAIAIVERALALFGPLVYVRHEVVHNRHVVEDLKGRGTVFVEDLAEVPEGAVVIFSAHGVSRKVREEAAGRGLRVLDATCPLVTKVHMEVIKHARAGRECILIGHRGHPEVEGTLGQYQNPAGGIYLVEGMEDVLHLQVKNPEDLAYVTQTTLSVDDTRAIVGALKARFPNIREPRRDDICYATQNRQDAVKALARRCDLVLVVGSRNSSNSNRLRETAERLGTPAYLIDDASQIEEAWLEGKGNIGVTAGASAPEALVKGVVERLRALGAQAVASLEGREEKIAFSLPRSLL